MLYKLQKHVMSCPLYLSSRMLTEAFILPSLSGVLSKQGVHCSCEQPNLAVRTNETFLMSSDNQDLKLRRLMRRGEEADELHIEIPTSRWLVRDVELA